jgi:hypothetical protein
MYLYYFCFVWFSAATMTAESMEKLTADKRNWSPLKGCHRFLVIHRLSVFYGLPNSFLNVAL